MAAVPEAEGDAEEASAGVGAGMEFSSARAMKKFNQLDKNQNGCVDGNEVLELAEWVWCSFHPGEEIDIATKVGWREKLLVYVYVCVYV